ncbi:AbrB family transcriptional regulator [Bacillus toyonensis]|uniref:AbrB/MazE/SpoVT family DNA-binding domain-containing protein n=1 Tax=Bacillus toyonensis TaxID=155322 RepID=UPI000BEBD163|nr:AbrB/MazE/SpoVT family DNA-binding domain-containing protein [Bacillus toyonensis]PEE20767.1 AbrB family transcriptional regulator [Bacillus toyonensis]
MRTTGILRNMDKLGRLVIPKELRRTLGIDEGDHIEVFRNKENIVIRKMETPGIVRKIDKLGRLVIPMELRSALDISNADPLEFLMNENEIILRKYRPANACFLTGEIDRGNVILAGGKLVLSPQALQEVAAEIKKLGV